ncbi:MAG: hypothetical protein NTY00_02885 [Deltaproteobacteria bacterium]|nr:hypothetical protein [Deltaproteobacteria bacterium]
MFLDQELKKIQEDKNRLAICCDLRRRLVHIEVQGIWCGVRRTFSNLSLGLALAEQILSFLRDRKGSHR